MVIYCNEGCVNAKAPPTGEALQFIGATLIIKFSSWQSSTRATRSPPLQSGGNE
jgi:hypothetical protein